MAASACLALEINELSLMAEGQSRLKVMNEALPDSWDRKDAGLIPGDLWYDLDKLLPLPGPRGPSCKDTPYTSRGCFLMF